MTSFEQQDLLQYKLEHVNIPEDVSIYPLSFSRGSKIKKISSEDFKKVGSIPDLHGYKDRALARCVVVDHDTPKDYTFSEKGFKLPAIDAIMPEEITPGKNLVYFDFYRRLKQMKTGSIFERSFNYVKALRCKIDQSYISATLMALVNTVDDKTLEKNESVSLYIGMISRIRNICEHYKAYSNQERSDTERESMRQEHLMSHLEEKVKASMGFKEQQTSWKSLEIKVRCADLTMVLCSDFDLPIYKSFKEVKGSEKFFAVRYSDEMSSVKSELQVAGSSYTLSAATIAYEAKIREDWLIPLQEDREDLMEIVPKFSLRAAVCFFGDKFIAFNYRGGSVFKYDYVPLSSTELTIEERVFAQSKSFFNGASCTYEAKSVINALLQSPETLFYKRKQLPNIAEQELTENVCEESNIQSN